MKRLLLKLTIPTLLVGIIVACTSGSGGFAGIGGSGYISTGTVTGFGSVFVNGVEYDTSSARFEIEDVSGSQQDLSIGMVVQVQGSVNSDGVTGTATAIRYGDHVEGPVAGTLARNQIEVNGDLTEKSFRVLGTNVVVDAVETVFKGVNFSFDTLTLENHVEISGYFDQNDVLRATYVELKAARFASTSDVEVAGFISGLSGTSFSIRGVNVNAAAANHSDLPGGLQNGLYVEVKGTYSIAGNTINATRVENESIEYRDDGSEIHMEGLITRFVSASDFDINGYPINASTAAFEPAGLQSQLRAGIKVEAEGTVSNGVLNASEVEIRGGDAEIHATVGDVNAAAGSFTLNLPPTGAAVTVVVNTATSLKDDWQEIEPFRLSNLNSGDFVEVVGYETGIDTVTANLVKRREPAGPVLLQGVATAANGSINTSTGGDLTILGVTYLFNSTATRFEDVNDQPLSPAGVDALLLDINTSASVLIKITDENQDGTAEEIDRED